jgi:hypothetical protein
VARALDAALADEVLGPRISRDDLTGENDEFTPAEFGALVERGVRDRARVEARGRGGPLRMRARPLSGLVNARQRSDDAACEECAPLRPNQPAWSCEGVCVHV